MELNKRKSLLTPAAPTVWGMIHGDINNQQDIVDRISEKVEEATGDKLTNKILGEVLAVINPMLNEALEQKQPTLVAGENIKTLGGRSVLGEGDLDPLDDNDRTILNTVDSKADKYDTYTKKQVDNLISNVEVDTSDLATKQELQDLREGDVQGALMNSSAAYNMADSALTKTEELDAKIGTIDTMTDDILA